MKYIHTFKSFLNESKISDRDLKRNLNTFHENVTGNLKSEEANILSGKAKDLFQTDDLSDLSLSDSQELATAVLSIIGNKFYKASELQKVKLSLGL
jgi:hypothetical protein